MSRRTVLQILSVAIVIQIPIWLQERTRLAYYRSITSSAKALLADNMTGTSTALASAEVTSIDWPLLKDLDGKVPNAKVKALNTKKITITGFMVPLEDKQNQVTEFLLVPSPMACIHVPAPSPQQIIYAIATKDAKVPVTMGAVTVTGTFYVAGNATPTASSMYTMEADTVTALK